MPNRLADESSPYLLQHAENPVDWHPWGETALEKARKDDKPIFLSIGYSACHWCHVMEHESFENDAIAEQLNRDFICIKVDREERPDLDQIYMNAVQLMTGRGGWPMSVFLTPELKPFFAGTYWPPTRRMGMPGFDEVVRAVLDAWVNRRAMAVEQSNELARRVQDLSCGKRDDAVAIELNDEILNRAFNSLQQMFDFRNGGFGQAPKFPHAMDLQLLLRYWNRTGHETAMRMVRLNLDKMADGGIYDHLGGGFARYSVDERWLVPHFEKMLYDNALLTEVYIDAHLATGDPRYATVARETLDYIVRDMTDPAGGFHSTEDADSEGEEGKFYVWSPEEIGDVLGEQRGEQFCAVYDVTAAGNFEGHSILNLRQPIERVASQRQIDAQQLQDELAEDRGKLFAHRERRIRPGKDDKVLASWNGLMIQAMSRAAVALDEPRYREAAVRAAEFIWTSMRREDGKLLHAYRHGVAKFDAYLEDYAYLANAFVTLYEATFDEAWIDRAVELAEQMNERFRDHEGGGFFFTAHDHEALIARNKDLHDSSVPSSTAMAATAMFRLGRLTGRSEFLEGADSGVQVAGELLSRSPAAAGQFLIAIDMMLGPFQEVVVVGADEEASTQALMQAAFHGYQPNRVIAKRGPNPTHHSGWLDAAFQQRDAVDGQTTVYICEQFSCQAPLTGDEAITELQGE